VSRSVPSSGSAAAMVLCANCGRPLTPAEATSVTDWRYRDQLCPRCVASFDWCDFDFVGARHYRRRDTLGGPCQWGEFSGCQPASYDVIEPINPDNLVEGLRPVGVCARCAHRALARGCASNRNTPADRWD
jgi:hypothetical protein